MTMFDEDDDFDPEDTINFSDAEDEDVKEAFEEEKYEYNNKRKLDDENHKEPKKKKKVSLEKVRTPTVKELNELRETQNLFHSNLFRLQIDEMLKEIQIKTKYRNLFRNWFEKLKSFLLALPKSEEHNLSDTRWLDSYKVKPPVIFTPKNEKGTFKFIHPDDVTIGGSFLLQASLGPTITVDVYVHMPPVCFQKTDHLNFQYIRKRALYLTEIAEALQDSDLVSETHFVQANGSHLKPVIEVLPCGKLGKRMRVLLWPVTQPDALHFQRLRPKRGNIHSQWFLGIPDSHGGSKEEQEPPSAYYNSEIAKDVVWQQNQDMLLADLDAQPLRDGLVLLKVWLHQRKLDQGFGGFNGFVLAMYLTYLVQARRINGMMSSYQIARITWNALANSDWTKEGITVSTASAGPSLSDFHELFDVVFVDASGLCNICAGVSPEVYFQVREESAQAIRFLDTAGLNSFQALFMTPMNIEQHCDLILRFQDRHKLEAALAKHKSPELSLKHGGLALPQLLHVMRGPLRKGLGHRVKKIILPPIEEQRWSCHLKPPKPSTFPSSLVLGLILDHELAFGRLDRGPPANTPEAEEFRAFWEERSQLRRFRDGGIHEAVLWDDRAPVCQQIVQFILQKYVGLDPDSFLYLGNEAVQLAKPKIKKLPEGEAATRVIIVAFHELTKELRAVRGLPLAINSIQGISPVFHYCDVFPPLPLKRWNAKLAEEQVSNKSPCSCLSKNLKRLPYYCPVIEAVMTLEHSGKWPHDLEAVKRLKAAVCIQMATLYSRQFNTLAYPSTEYFHIYREGYVFRIWLGYLREVALLKEKILSDGSTMYQSNPKSRVVEDRIELLPRLSSTLHGIQQQFPGFGPTVCLAKRWLSAQLLGPPHIPEVVTELLVAYLFLSPEPFQPAVQGELGFLRFLSLVSTTNWHTTPIILNLNREFTVEQIAELEGQFNSSRQKCPPLFLATPFDKSPSHWTREAPSLQILIRLAVLAKEALKFLKTQLLESSQPDYLPVFRPNMAVYDAKIFLQPRSITHIRESIDDRPSEKTCTIQKYVKIPGEKMPIIDFDPVQKYLVELREGYSHCALFFHDRYGGDTIGVLWKPSAFEKRDFKVSAMKGDKLLKNSKVCLNKDAIVEDFYVLGSGIVKSIDEKSRKTELNEVTSTSVR